MIGAMGGGIVCILMFLNVWVVYCSSNPCHDGDNKWVNIPSLDST